ncbi:MAG TPA: hypothetical protein DCZ49_04250 [Hyphomonadaceae bacterium]|nr:hypothetical protein [Hyphomonadaceae bacterium]
MDEFSSSNLIAAMPNLYFFRDTHWNTAGDLFVRGIIADRNPDNSRQIQMTWNGLNVPAEWISYLNWSEQDHRFWFVPHQNRRFVQIRVPAKHASLTHAPHHTIDIIARDPSDDSPRVFAIYPDLEQLAPLPPIVSIERVSGKGATAYNYVNNGRTDFLRFSILARQHGVEVNDPTVKILDWGCGCARLTRHFLELPNGRNRVVGVDIDADNIAWSSNNISPNSFLSAR